MIDSWHRYPFRRVVNVQFTTTRYNRSGEGSNKFTLDCGHTVWAKLSDGEPKRKRCRDCWIQYTRAARLLHD